MPSIPITTVSSCFGKLFTLVNERLVEFLDLRNTLSYFQTGYIRRYRTSDHVFILNTILNSYFHKGKRVYSCFVDFSKAYDSVWRDGLLYKLILNGLSFKFVSLISSMYDDLQMTVKLSNGITPFFSSLMDVRQGCNLSPLLFDIFVNDIFDIFDGKECCPVNLHNKPIICLMYADDLLILSETDDGLTECLQRLNRYSHKWKMTISTKKTKIMIFNKSCRMIRLKIRIGELTIESCFQYKYLGTVFTPNKNFKKAQSELYKKACRAFFGYLKEVNIQAISTIRKLFNTLVSPILLYNSEIWGAFLKKKQLKSFESFVDNMFDDSSKHECLQMKMGKIALGVHKKSPNMAVRGELGMFPLTNDMYARIVNYFFTY